MTSEEQRFDLIKNRRLIHVLATRTRFPKAILLLTEVNDSQTADTVNTRVCKQKGNYIFHNCTHVLHNCALLHYRWQLNVVKCVGLPFYDLSFPLNTQYLKMSPLTSYCRGIVLMPLDEYFNVLSMSSSKVH